MDLAQFDLKTISEKGSWVHLEHDGELLGDEGKPCRIHIRGIGYPEVMAACKKALRLQTALQTRLAKTDGDKVDDLIEEYERKAEDASNELILAAVDKWENIEWGKKRLAFNDDNVLKICGQGTLFHMQIANKIFENNRHFTKAVNA